MFCFILFFFLFFFFNDTATTEIYTLSLHDALPICATDGRASANCWRHFCPGPGDRKSTRLNSSHLGISYAVFCLKKKKNTQKLTYRAKKRNVRTEEHPTEIK